MSFWRAQIASPPLPTGNIHQNWKYHSNVQLWLCLETDGAVYFVNPPIFPCVLCLSLYNMVTHSLFHLDFLTHANFSFSLLFLQPFLIFLWEVSYLHGHHDGVRFLFAVAVSPLLMDLGHRSRTNEWPEVGEAERMVTYGFSKGERGFVLAGSLNRQGHGCQHCCLTFRLHCSRVHACFHPCLEQEWCLTLSSGNKKGGEMRDDTMGRHMILHQLNICVL